MENNSNQIIGESDVLCGVCLDDVQQAMKDVTCGECQRWFYHASGKISSSICTKV